MKDPANAVVDKLGLRKRLVTALVSNNPEASRKETRAEAVEGPKREACSGIEQGVWEGKMRWGNESVQITCGLVDS